MNYPAAYYQIVHSNSHKNFAVASTFFFSTKNWPKKQLTNNKTVDRIIALRKQNYSIVDIKVTLDAEGKKISLDTIDHILKTGGFASLPKKTRIKRLAIALPSKLEAPKSVMLEIVNGKEV